MGKPKRKLKVFSDELLPGEEILWAGKPDPWKLLAWQDFFFVACGLGWCLMIYKLFGGMPRLVGFDLAAIPLLIVAAYMLFGRYFYKFWRKRNTYYAVTNRRILMLTNFLGSHFQGIPFEDLPTVKQSIGMDGESGSITFGFWEKQAWLRRGWIDVSNTGLEFLGGNMPGFYDIDNVSEVFQLIDERWDRA